MSRDGTQARWWTPIARAKTRWTEVDQGAAAFAY